MFLLWKSPTNTMEMIQTATLKLSACRSLVYKWHNDFLMLDISSKMINGGGRSALVLHAQRMKMFSYVQPVVRELSDSWHRSALTLDPLPVRDLHRRGCRRRRQIFIKFHLFAYEIFLQNQIYSY